MLDEEDWKKMAALLEAYGLKKLPSLAARRQKRWRERNKALQAPSPSVTRSPRKRINGVTARHTVTDETPIVIAIPLNDGSEFGVTEKMTAEFAGLYPAVDVPQTLREVRGWSLSNASKRKTREGIMKHINFWLKEEQNKG